VLRAWLAVVIVGWLPGAIIFRLPWMDRDRRAALDVEERFFWAVMLSVAASLAIVLVLGAYQSYSFERLLIADCAVALIAALVARRRLGFGGVAARPSWTMLMPIALVLLCAWRFFPSSEYIAGGKDPGNYVNEGIQIAQRGSLLIRDPVVASVPPFARDLFFPSHRREEYYSNRFMGFFLQDPDTGLVAGQFPHLFPASIAIGYGLDGLSGARRTVGVWATLGVLAVYFAGARLIGRRAAAVAAALLAVHVIQTWFSRYPNVEVVMQALLFTALLANARALVDSDRFFALVAGVFLGLLLFLRYDVVVAIAGIAAGMLLAAVDRKRPHWSFIAILATAVVLAIPYYLGTMRASIAFPLAFVDNLKWWHLACLAGGAIVILAVLVISARRPAARALAITSIPFVVIAGGLTFAAYALFFRHPGGRLAAHDAYALRTFTNLYLTLPGLIAALIGFAIVVQRRFWRDPAVILTITLLSFFLFYKIRIVPEHFWMMRRFLPVVLPGALLFVAAAALSREEGRWRGARLLRPLIGLAFIGLLAAHYSRVSTPLLAHVEYAGLIPQIEKLASMIHDDDLLIVESRDAGSDVHVLATPLAYIYARNVLLLHSAKPDKRTFAAFVDWAKAKYQRVLFLGGGGTDLLSHRYGLEAVASDRYQVPEYEVTLDRVPRISNRKEFDYGVYRFTAATARDGQWFDLDVGVRDDLHVVRFHAKEKTDETTFRWTGRLSFVTVTVLHPSARQVTLWMSNGGRPAAVAPADVQVSLHNQVLGTVRVSDGFKQYALAIPADLAAHAAAFGDPVELRFITPPWNPLKVLGRPDDRELGVMVDRVQVR
jgi:Dolichyl-phosphate-mannose-protein mannosyltransferase